MRVELAARRTPALALPFKGRVGWGWVCHGFLSLAFLSLVIPAKAGIQLLPSPSGRVERCAGEGADREAFALTKCKASAHLKVSGLLLFAWPKRSNQEKGHPVGAVSRHPAFRLREGTTGFAGCTSMYIRRTGAHRVRPAAHFSSAPSPRLRGPGWAASCRRSEQQRTMLLARLEALPRGRAKKEPRSLHLVRCERTQET